MYVCMNRISSMYIHFNFLMQDSNKVTMPELFEYFEKENVGQGKKVYEELLPK